MVHIDDNKIAELMVAEMKSRGIGGTDGVAEFYPNNTVPTTGLPESFVEVVLNGPLSTPLSECGVGTCSVLLILNVALNGKDQPNTVRESYLYKRITDALGDSFRRGICHYSRDRKQLVYSGRNLYSGYSSKTMSFNVKIY